MADKALLTIHVLCLLLLLIDCGNIHSLIQSVRILWLSVFIIQQLHKALHVPGTPNRGQKAAFTQALHYCTT